jgi:hypothetical protein
VSWINDLETSPCIDFGDLTSEFNNVPNPNGGRANIGVYGNMTEASKSATTVSVDDFSNIENHIYPNPSSNIIRVSDTYNNQKFEIISLTGQIVKRGVISTSKINVSTLKSGIYFLKFIDINSKQTHIVKFIKDKK